MCVNDLPRVVLDSAEAGIEPTIQSQVQCHRSDGDGN